MKTKQRAAQKLARNVCFACGPENSQGMRLKFAIDPKDAVVRGMFRVPSKYQGSAKRVHGGILATVLDDAMGKLSRLDAIVAPTAELHVEYLRPVPVGQKIVVEARPIEQRGRSYWRECTIRDADGTLLVRGKGRFVKVGERTPPTP